MTKSSRRLTHTIKHPVSLSINQSCNPPTNWPRPYHTLSQPLCFEAARETTADSWASSTMPAAASSSGSSGAHMKEIRLGTSDAGFPLKLLESKHDSVRFEVWEQQPTRTVVWGQIRIMAFANRPTYKATCKIHKNCHCVINCLQHERLVEWLAVAGNKSASEHEHLSREVRTSLGMRIRNKS